MTDEALRNADELLEQTLSRLIIENRNEDGNIAMRDQSAMKDEIICLISEDRERMERELLQRIENMGDGEAKRQGMYTAHNMDGYHRAYGEIISHNVHNRLAVLTNKSKQKESIT